MVSGEKIVTRQILTDVLSVLTSVKGEWISSKAREVATEEETPRSVARKDSSKVSKNAALKKDAADVKTCVLITESVALSANVGKFHSSKSGGL